MAGQTPSTQDHLVDAPAPIHSLFREPSPTPQQPHPSAPPQPTPLSRFPVPLYPLLNMAFLIPRSNAHLQPFPCSRNGTPRFDVSTASTRRWRHGKTYAINPKVEYFWYQSRRPWALDCIPDPCDPNPVRYAIMASIAEELAKEFNWRLSLGMHRVKSQHTYRKSFDEELPPTVLDETCPSGGCRYNPRSAE
ncbi:hypothetical protein PENFLA_c040G08483 [Penicillium flavigenum]|uniref:Uncharacterized protein n=1 Tax=Penicillium flavigenum TaxID=254877 RepID=A0A1V6SKS4_9EURO|nr:hypothetical protein PENFLA_c040G08483 [Penicillium flavigenum]